MKQIWIEKLLNFCLIVYIEVIAFRVNHLFGDIVFHKHRALVIHYVGLSPVRKSSQIKSSQVRVSHHDVYKYSTVHIQTDLF